MHAQCNTPLGITRPWQEATIGLTAVGVFYQFLNRKWQRNIESALRLEFVNTYVEVDFVPKQGQLYMHNGPLTRYVELRDAECRERFPRHQLQRKPLLCNPAMHHDTCVTQVPWYMSGSLTHGGGEIVRGIPGARAKSNFTYHRSNMSSHVTGISTDCLKTHRPRK